LFSILLSASSFDEAVSRIYYYDTIARSEAEVIASINASQAELEQSQSELDSLNEELKAEADALQTLYDKQSEQTGAMRAQQAEAANYLASLSTEVQARIEEEEPELAGISQIVIEDEATRATQQAEVVNDQPAAEQQNQGQQQAAEQATANETQQAQETQQAEESQPTPEPVSYSNGSLSAVINAAWSIGPTRSDWGCAGWVYTVYRDAGVYDQMPRCAGWYAENFGYSSDLGDLMPGMVVAVTTHPYTAAGRIYGHCGIYVGDGIVRDYAGGGIRSVSIDDWINSYSSPGIPVRWGWVGGIPLS
jgi:cell wall-associated NlpC family hydrolase